LGRNSSLLFLEVVESPSFQACDDVDALRFVHEWRLAATRISRAFHSRVQEGDPLPYQVQTLHMNMYTMKSMNFYNFQAFCRTVIICNCTEKIGTISSKTR